MRLAKSGNVAATDAATLARPWRPSLTGGRRPGIHVCAVRVAPESPLNVTAQLDGDVDALRDIFSNVIEVAQSQRFFLDRRSLRSELVLGSVEVEGSTVVSGPGRVSVSTSRFQEPGQTWSPR